MLVENNYPSDTRVRNEANLLASSGYAVTVIALRRPGQPFTEVINGVRAYRMPRLELFKKTPSGHPGWFARVALKIKAVVGYACEYAYFTSGCFLLSCWVLVRHGFDAIHAHNPPDTSACPPVTIGIGASRTACVNSRMNGSLIISTRPRSAA